MFLYILKRILLMIPTLIGITLIAFFIMKLAPGDPIKLKLMFADKGLDPNALAAILDSETPPLELSQTYLSFAEKVGHIFQKEGDIKLGRIYRTMVWTGENTKFYLKWLSRVAVLDFGRSFSDHVPITDKLKQAIPITLAINILTILLVYLVSIPLGVWSAVKKGTVLDKLVMIKLFVLYAVPTFWVASLVLIYLAGGDYLNLFPIIGLKSESYASLGLLGKMTDVAWHLFLPVVVSALGSFAFLSRFVRSNFLDVLSQDFIRTARAKGLSEFTVLYKHAFRNALIPFVTLMGTLLPALLGGSVVIEQIFNIPGMGMMAFQAVLSRDYNVVMAVTTLGAFLTLVSLLLSDLLYGLVDPRIRVS